MPQDAYVVEQCSKIEEVLEYAAERFERDAKTGGYLAGYISVLISGVVEDCIEYLVLKRAQMSNDPQLCGFVRTSIDRQFRNPNSRDIANLLGNFSPGYQTQFQDSVNNEAREALGSIVSNRMSLAHRGEPQSQFTVNEIRRYFSQIVDLLEVVEKILLPSANT